MRVPQSRIRDVGLVVSRRISAIATGEVAQKGHLRAYFQSPNGIPIKRMLHSTHPEKTSGLPPFSIDKNKITVYHTPFVRIP